MNLKPWRQRPRVPRYLFVALAMTLFLGVSGVQAADGGPRHHAEGTLDTAAGIYEVVKGDDLDAIAERLGVTVQALKDANKLDSDVIDVGQKLAIASAGEGAKAGAVQVTGVLGSPSATTTIPGNQLPPPSPPFGGEIERNAIDSTPWWPPRVVPPKGAPNVLLIMTDDQGFALPSTFGGVIPTPALDRIANNGLRYTNFHSVAVCSATRAALITGRNHHEMGFGTVSETATGFPGYNSIMTRDKATIGKILKDNGYRTSWFGKDHNTPAFQASQAGPFDQWPTGMGFDYFYGFVGGDTNQWQPNLFRNTTADLPLPGQPRLEPDHRPGG